MYLYQSPVNFAYPLALAIDENVLFACCFSPGLRRQEPIGSQQNR